MLGVVIWSVVVLLLLFFVLYAANKAGQPGSRGLAPLDARGVNAAFRNVWRRAQSDSTVIDTDLDGFLASTTEPGPGYLTPAADLSVVVDQAKQGIGTARQSMVTAAQGVAEAAQNVTSAAAGGITRSRNTPPPQE